MNNSNFKKKDTHRSSFKKWLPAIFFALTIHLLLVALLLYTSNTKKNTEHTNNKINQPDLPATLTAQLENTSDTTNNINSQTNKNGIPSAQTTALNNNAQINKQNDNSGSTSNLPKENKQTLSSQATNPNPTTKPPNDSKPSHHNKNDTVISKPLTETKSNTTSLVDSNSNAKADNSVSNTINNLATDNMASSNVKEANQNKGNAILIEGIDTPSQEVINTVKDQLTDDDKKVNELIEQNNQAKKEVAMLHEQTTNKIDAIIKHNQQAIKQNNQQQKLEFEQINKLGDQN